MSVHGPMPRSAWVFPALAVLFFAADTASGVLFIPSVAGLAFAVALLAILFGTVFAAVHHAEAIAERIGEPYGTLLLTLAVTIIEVALIATIMLGEKAVPTLARDTVFAVVMIVCNGLVGICILTGGPGTGKSTSIRALLMLLRMRKIDVALAAPTGRAAKRLSEATGAQAKTLHRLLEYAPHDNSYQRNEDNPLPYQFVVVDEFSMVDILLFYHLLKALPRESHLLLVGDADQLPSVGPGNVLRDLLRCEAVPSIRLTELFRQAKQSKIIVNAHRINAGHMPNTKVEATSDFFFMAEEDPLRVQQIVLELVQRRLPARYHFKPMTDIQVLSPMYKGPVGVSILNEKLQAHLNPTSAAQVELGDRVLRIGDKVMQIRNNYDKGVFNGDVGWIRSIHKENATLKVEFVEEAGPLFVSYEFHELDELILAYAVTVHKSQGSEYPVVIIPLVKEHRMLLQRNLLYTAITRAKRFCVLVGQPYALELAVRNDRVALRNTALAERLMILSKDRSSTLTSL